MFRSITNNTAKNLSAGGTISGDVTISGDLTVQGAGSLAYDEVLTGSMSITRADAVTNPATDTNAGLLIENTNASGSAILRMRGGDGAARIMYGENNSTDKLYISARNQADAYVVVDQIGRLGIGAESPTQMLHIASSTDAFIQLERVDTTVADNDAIGAILFRGGESSIADIGRIRLHADADFTSSSSPTKMVFETTPSGATADAVALTLDSSQNATFAGELDVNPATNKRIKFTFPTDEYANESRIGFSDLNAHITYKAQNNFMEIWSYSSLFLQTGSSATTALTIDSSQNATFGGDVNISSGKNINFSPSVYTSAVQGIKFDQDGGTADAIIQPVRVGDVGVIMYIGSNTFVNTSGGNDRYNDSEESAGIEVRHDGQIRFLTGGTGADPTAKMVIDSNSVISLSNNDSGDNNTVFGYGSGANIDANSDENVFIGHQVSGNGTNSSSLYNVGIGFKSLFDLTGGDGNTAIGHRAMFEATEGQFNVAIGKDSLKNLTSGSSNVAIGTDALGNPTSAENIIAIGRGAAYAVDSDDADGTVAIGRSALASLTSGKKNLAVGYGALNETTIGDANIAIGYNAMFGDNAMQNDLNIAIGGENAAGSVLAAMGGQWTSNRCEQNIAIGTGSLAGAMNDSHDNVAVGYKALNAVTTADDNVAIGSGTGQVTTTGGANTIVGYQALNGDVDGDGADNTALGHKSLHDAVSPSKNVAIGDSAMRGLAGPANGIADCVAIGANAFYGSGDNTTVATDGTVAIGKDGLKALTSGAGNLAIGYQSADAITSGDYNTAIGYQALSTEDTGDRNTAIGYGALVNANGANNNANTAVGFQSGANVTTGIENTLIGEHSGLYITTGNYNTALGNKSMGTIVDGLRNTAIGYGAMRDTDSGTTVDGSDDNTFVGYTAGGGEWVNEDISKITAIGSQAMRGNLETEASGTVAIGYLALYALTSGTSNVAVGSNALENITTGGYNTVVGHEAMQNAQAAVSLSTAVGYRAGYKLGDDGASDHSDANIMIGYSALGGGSGTVATNTANHNIAIGNNSLGGGSSTASTMAGNTVIGHDASKVATNGADNTIIGKDACATMTTGYFNTVIGKGANPSAVGGTNQIVIGRATTGTGDDEIALGNTSISAIKAQVTSITAYSSDERTKKDIADYDLKGVDFIKELSLKTYIYKNPADFPDEIRDSKWDEDGVERLEDPTETQVGLIAQEVESALAKHNVGNTETYAPTQDSGIKTLTYGNLIFPLIKAVQELSARVEELEGK